jgi:hypothetical protein
MGRPKGAKNKINPLKRRGPFYVYHILGDDGSIVYVGCGSGLRLEHSKWRLKGKGKIVAGFDDRAQALAYEREQIRLLNPPANILGKDNGGAHP